MSAPNHAPEPWRIDTEEGAISLITRVVDADGYWVCDNEPYYAQSVDPENAARIVACVNACAGMDDPAAEIAALRASEESRHYDQAAHLACLKQRDALAAALRKIASNDPYKVSSAGIIARAALAKLGGGS